MEKDSLDKKKKWFTQNKNGTFNIFYLVYFIIIKLQSDATNLVYQGSWAILSQ